MRISARIAAIAAFAASFGAFAQYPNKPIKIIVPFAPANTPREIVGLLNAAVNKVLQQVSVREKYAGVGAVTTGGTPGQFAAYIAEDLARWTKVVRDANVKVE